MTYLATMYSSPGHPKQAGSAIIYARAACHDGSYTSIAPQLAACREWAQANGYAIVGECHEVGNGRRSTRLPQLAEAIAQAEKQSAALVCAEPDRLSRDARVLDEVLADCAQRGVQVHFVNGQTSLGIWQEQ